MTSAAIPWNVAEKHQTLQLKVLTVEAEIREVLSDHRIKVFLEWSGRVIVVVLTLSSHRSPLFLITVGNFLLEKFGSDVACDPRMIALLVDVTGSVYDATTPRCNRWKAEIHGSLVKRLLTEPHHPNQNLAIMNKNDLRQFGGDMQSRVKYPFLPSDKNDNCTHSPV